MLRIAHSIVAALDLFLPPTCLLCSESLLSEQTQRHFCAACLGKIQPLTSGACRRCAQPYQSSEANHLCESCLKNPPPFSSVSTAGKYDNSIRNAVHQLKYRNQLLLGRPLGELLATSIHNHLDEFIPDCVIPVPLHTKRLRARGYNQALEIARPIAKKLQAPLEPRLLQRVRNTPQQQGLSARERRQNLRGAFSINCEFKADKVLLVDDVMTTGETVRECSRVLLAHGAKEIRVAVAGRA